MSSGLYQQRTLEEIYSDGVILQELDFIIEREKLRFGLFSSQFYDKQGRTVKIKETLEPEPTYSEEELVPSQFFGLDDYLKLN